MFINNVLSNVKQRIDTSLFNYYDECLLPQVINFTAFIPNKRLLLSRGVICKRGKERGMRALVSIVQFYFITIQADLTVKKKKRGETAWSSFCLASNFLPNE